MILDFRERILGAETITRRHRLAGTVTVDGLPAQRYVTVFDRRNYTWVASAISNAVTGAWEITGLPEYPERALLVVALDTTGNYNAEVADYITQVATA